jgi:serine/threonine protein kinase/outer membrane protein assembly factor BamD (BamD/ComL family)
MANTRKDPFVGTRIREYEVLSVIGKGGMGAVYKARHVYLDEERAIKVIQTNLAEDNDFVERFIREAKILSKLRHPNLVQLYEFGTLAENTFFMVMELIRGESVLERLRRKNTIPIDEAIRIIRQAALGLHSAHQKGIIHRDISPDNLMLVKDDAGDEITKVLDFGIAKPLAEGTHAATATNMFLGKPEYSSPEQCGFLEEGEIIDRRSDIYSLAVTLYYMVAGKLPFYSATPQGYLVKHVTEQPKPITTTIAPGKSAEMLDPILQKALAKKRDDRQSTMEEFARELEQVIATDQNLLTQVNPPEPVSEAPIRLEPGNIFARRYLIEKKLGEGGMGAVFKATDKILEVPVALKVMSARVVQDDITLERFKREVILARKVAHPNACRIYDIGESHGVHYVSMEYVEGKTLSDMLQDGRLPVEVGLPIIEQVLEALNEAHRVGIVHRDLKPQNIMVDTNRRAHILDFGISISADARRVTQTGLIVGTPHYMSPEQFEGKNVDHRSDIYSIGVIMYEMLSGKLPFEGTSAMAIIYAHLKSNPAKLTELVPDLNPQLEKIILRCLEKDVTKRYQNVQEVLSQIEPLMQGEISDVSRERLAHKFLAERSYSKAIKFLNSMLQTDPGNQQYKKLLHIAIGEKVRKDLHRAKSLIRKDNLVQAQLLLEKVHRFAPKTDRVISQVKKVEKLLSEERAKKLEQFLTEANAAVEARDWNGALAKAQSAWNLSPNNTRVTELQEKIQRLQQAELHAQLAEIKNTYNVLIGEPNGDPAQLENLSLQLQNRLDAILKISPSFAPAEQLHREVNEFRELQIARRKLVKEFDTCLQPLASENYAEAVNRLSKLISQVSIPAVRQQLGTIEKGVRDLDASLRKENYEEAKRIASDLLQKDSGGWLRPHAKILERLRSQAEQKERTRQKFAGLFEKGKSLFDDRRWDEAIKVLEEALQINSSDSVCRELLQSSQKQSSAERQLRADLSRSLNEVSELLARKDFAKARERLERSKELFTPQFRLNDVEQQWKALQNQLQSDTLKESARHELISREMAKASAQYEKGEFQQALLTVEDVLKNEPQLDAALQLQSKIQKEIKAEEQAVREFRQLFDDGKKHYDEMEWEKAIRCWNKALELSPKNAPIQQWIDAAQSRWDIQRQIAEDINKRLRQFDQAIANKDLQSASGLVEEATRLLTNEYRLGDLPDLISAKRGQLQTEIEKDTRRAAFIKRDIDEAKALCARDQHEAALEKMTELLKVEPEVQEAIQLQSDIRASLEQRRARQKQFSAFFEEGTNALSGGNWEKALASFDKADGIQPGDPRVRESQNQARQMIREFSQIRDRLNSASREIEDHLRHNRWEKAITAGRKALSTDLKGHPFQNELTKIQEWVDVALQRKNEAEAEVQSAVAPVAVPPAPALPLAKWAIPAVAAIVAIGIIAFLLLRPSPSPPAVLSIVTVNAVPWANVKIVPSNEKVKMPDIEKDETTTPCNFSLPEGEYTIELDNGGITPPLTQKIKVEAGKTNSFFFQMPTYDPKTAFTASR